MELRWCLMLKYPETRRRSSCWRWGGIRRRAGHKESSLEPNTSSNKQRLSAAELDGWKCLLEEMHFEHLHNPHGGRFHSGTKEFAAYCEAIEKIVASLPEWKRNAALAVAEKYAAYEPKAKREASPFSKWLNFVMDRADYEVACAEEAHDHYGEDAGPWWYRWLWLKTFVRTALSRGYWR